MTFQRVFRPRKWAIFLSLSQFRTMHERKKKELRPEWKWMHSNYDKRNVWLNRRMEVEEIKAKEKVNIVFLRMFILRCSPLSYQLYIGINTICIIFIAISRIECVTFIVDTFSYKCHTDEHEPTNWMMCNITCKIQKEKKHERFSCEIEKCHNLHFYIRLIDNKRIRSAIQILFVAFCHFHTIHLCSAHFLILFTMEKKNAISFILFWSEIPSVWIYYIPL